MVSEENGQKENLRGHFLGTIRWIAWFLCLMSY